MLSESLFRVESWHISKTDIAIFAESFIMHMCYKYVHEYFLYIFIMM